MVDLPFDPDIEWGQKDRHYVAGTIHGFTYRGVIDAVPARLQLGPSWCRDPRVRPGNRVDVTIGPEGPQLDSMSADIRAAFEAEPGARRFFESLATFYRTAYVTWIEEARRPETRAKRIGLTVAALKAGRRER
jgi:hypothetical protein